MKYISLKSLVIILSTILLINCSEDENKLDQSINVDLITTETSIAIEVGSSKTIEITSGSGEYKLEGSPKVSLELDKNNIKFTGVKFGEATIKLIDIKTNESKNLSVTVTVKSFKYEDIILVEGGSFKMGSTIENEDAKPIHDVLVGDYYISKYEVTNSQFVEFLNEKGNKEEGYKVKEKWYGADWGELQITEKDGRFTVIPGKEKYPITNVTWYGAKAYTKWVGGRLPSEAEWEFAARGGEKSKKYLYSGSNNASFVGHLGDYDAGSIEVGKKEANELGIYDMTGNVSEYCEDKWNKTYEGAPTDGSAWNTGGIVQGDLFFTKRGGHYYADEEEATITYRSGSAEETRSGSIGFRIVFEK